MKRLGLALIAAVAIGCSSGPTAPSAVVGNATPLTIQDHKPNPGSQTHTITLYFLANGFALRRPVGLPVTVWWPSNPAGQVLTLNARGAVTFVVPWTDLWIGYSVPDWQGVCARSEELAIPGGTAPTWNHSETLKTGCAVP